MQQDIRELLKNRQEQEINLSKNHEANFQKLMHQKLHTQAKQQSKFSIKKLVGIAASALLIVSVLMYVLSTKNIEPNQPIIPKKDLTLGAISPELNTIETYYVNSINLAISELSLNDDNKDVVDAYLAKIAELTNEYKLLTQELNTKGVNDVTIDALINNLQLRLQLLQRLKKELKQLNNLKTKQHETVS